MPASSDALLDRHLGAWLGAWPSPQGTVTVVASARRDQPGWDGRRHPLVGVMSPDGAVLSVPPDRADAVRDVVGQRPPNRLAEVHGPLAAALGASRSRLIDGIFRWSSTPAPLPDTGTWLPTDHPAVPAWLEPFGGEVLVVLDGDAYIAGVGLKRHDPTGWEIAVVTEEAARGRGLARALVCQAARRVVAQGGVATYLHAPSNTASAHVADASGFPDLGWRVLALAPLRVEDAADGK